MIYHYGVTQQGAYHVKNNTVCQDAHRFENVADGFAIGAAADGLGSELYSDIASKIAVYESVEFVKANITEDTPEEEILNCIKNAFQKALDTINEKAAADGHNADQYDTTLDLCVFLNDRIYFGHSGDGGILVLNSDGTFEAVTVQQRDENGCVFPLFFGEEKWKFGMKENVSSVLLATDGMYETLFPYLLKGEAVPIYTALARFLLHEDALGFKTSGEEAVQKKMDSFIAGIPGNQVSDDKTVLVMLNGEAAAGRQPEAYYAAPDWAALKKKRDEEYRRLAYPHLYAD